MRSTTIALLLSAALGAAGCQSDDAVERDAQDATEEVGKEAKEAGKDAEKALPGDADDDGK
jgi:cytochrome c556